ncbi:MAG: YigZ family protein [Flavobacteriales bacterium CG03_land_8_20_14_0_80_35_15]|nr:MAG: YigZ family protein [Flavobacteriales bacterium CG03_land_8_20_14_0_80_35_15]
MNEGDYFTLETPVSGAIFKDKGSKFLGFAFPIQSEAAIKPLIDNLKKEHHAARHYCYAWQLGVETIIYRTNDDGEPSNSAGKPIYGQIVSKNLTNILVVVVRYYGGINLGVGGLIHAYKTAAQNCLNEVCILKKTLQTELLLKFDYKYLNKVMHFIKEYKLTFKTQKMELVCEIKLLISKSEVSKIEILLTEMQGVNFKIL